MNKRGQGITLSLLATFAVIFVGVIITTTISAEIVERIDGLSMFATGTVPRNLTTQGLQGLQQFAEFYPITGLVIIGSVIIGLLVAFR